jgi:hypothetical protein
MNDLLKKKKNSIQSVKSLYSLNVYWVTKLYHIHYYFLCYLEYNHILFNICGNFDMNDCFSLYIYISILYFH